MMFSFPFAVLLHFRTRAFAVFLHFRAAKPGAVVIRSISFAPESRLTRRERAGRTFLHSLFMSFAAAVRPVFFHFFKERFSLLRADEAVVIRVQMFHEANDLFDLDAVFTVHKRHSRTGEMAGVFRLKIRAIAAEGAFSVTIAIPAAVTITVKMSAVEVGPFLLFSPRSIFRAFRSGTRLSKTDRSKERGRSERCRQKHLFHLAPHSVFGRFAAGGEKSKNLRLPRGPWYPFSKCYKTRGVRKVPVEKKKK